MAPRRLTGHSLPSLINGLVLFSVLLVAGVSCAETIYKSIGPDGKVTYSDRPATGERLQKTIEYRDLPASPLPESVRRYREALQAGVERRLSGPAATVDAARLFTAAWCGYCRKARRHLVSRGIAFREIDIESSEGMRTYADIGGNGVPVLTWNGQRIDGYSPDAYDAFADAIGSR